MFRKDIKYINMYTDIELSSVSSFVFIVICK